LETFEKPWFVVILKNVPGGKLLKNPMDSSSASLRSIRQNDKVAGFSKLSLNKLI
jgi:hypothetical protein